MYGGVVAVWSVVSPIDLRCSSMRLWRLFSRSSPERMRALYFMSSASTFSLLSSNSSCWLEYPLPMYKSMHTATREMKPMFFLRTSAVRKLPNITLVNVRSRCFLACFPPLAPGVLSTARDIALCGALCFTGFSDFPGMSVIVFRPRAVLRCGCADFRLFLRQWEQLPCC